MDDFGKELKAGRIKRAAESLERLQAAEAEIGVAKKAAEEAGFSTEKINARGWMTVMQRIDYLVDEGSWTPLHSYITRRRIWKERPTSSTVSQKSLVAGPSSSASTTRSWREPGCPDSPKTFSG